MIFLYFFPKHNHIFQKQRTMIDTIYISSPSGFNKISSFYDERYFHGIFYKPVLLEIEKKSWTELDFHKDKMRSCLNKIRHITWIVVDEDKYNLIYFPQKMNTNSPPGLTMSRYGHISLGDKCYPNSKECVECFKYHCVCCSEGTNCMYGGRCSSRRCSNTINQISFLKNNIISPKRVYVFDFSNDGFFDY